MPQTWKRKTEPVPPVAYESAPPAEREPFGHRFDERSDHQQYRDHYAPESRDQDHSGGRSKPGRRRRRRNGRDRGGHSSYGRSGRDDHQFDYPERPPHGRKDHHKSGDWRKNREDHGRSGAPRGRDTRRRGGGRRRRQDRPPPLDNHDHYHYFGDDHRKSQTSDMIMDDDWSDQRPRSAVFESSSGIRSARSMQSSQKLDEWNLESVYGVDTETHGPPASDAHFADGDYYRGSTSAQDFRSGDPHYDDHGSREHSMPSYMDDQWMEPEKQDDVRVERRDGEPKWMFYKRRSQARKRSGRGRRSKRERRDQRPGSRDGYHYDRDGRDGRDEYDDEHKGDDSEGSSLMDEDLGYDDHTGQIEALDPSRDRRELNETQRESLAMVKGDSTLSERAKNMIEELMFGSYPCAVCHSNVKRMHRVWTCVHCQKVLHLDCINRWAQARCGITPHSLDDSHGRSKGRRRGKKGARSKQGLSDEQLILLNSLSTLKCPACNMENEDYTYDRYRCWCSGYELTDFYKMSSMSGGGSLIPHACGNQCSRIRGAKGVSILSVSSRARPTACTHRCPAPCHPGPCLPCNVITKFAGKCECGSTEYHLKCSELSAPISSEIAEKALLVDPSQLGELGKPMADDFGVEYKRRTCDTICGKILNCGIHQCESKCHSGKCKDCEVIVNATCFCGKNVKTDAVCGKYHREEVSRRKVNQHEQSDHDDSDEELIEIQVAWKFECGDPCDRLLKCGNHRCTWDCHSGSCSVCPRQVIDPPLCACGKTRFPSVMVECKEDDSSQQQNVSELVMNDDDLMVSDNDDDDNGDSDSGGDSSEEESGSSSYGQTAERKREIELALDDTSSLNIVTKKATTKPKKKENNMVVLKKVDYSLPYARRSCLDPLPTCDKKCERMLDCGEHYCSENCHDSECPTCSIKKKIKCACQKEEFIYACGEFAKRTEENIQKHMDNGDIIYNKWDWVKCRKMCRKILTCGKHKCKEVCCPGRTLSNRDFDGHICQEICGKPLSCGLHNCESRCHPGPCNPCGVTYRDGLGCSCGMVYLPGPLSCGSVTLPKCTNKCQRLLDCGHSCTRLCHYGDCGQCYRKVDRPCVTHQNVVRNIPCYVKSVSCGRKCHLLLPCGIHECQRTCHSGECYSELTLSKITNIGMDPNWIIDQMYGDVNRNEEEEFDRMSMVGIRKYAAFACEQICQLPIAICGHACPLKCHPHRRCVSPHECREQVKVSCLCGNANELDVCRGRDPSELIGVLECTEACRIAERNLRFREAFGIIRDGNSQSQSGSSSSSSSSSSSVSIEDGAICGGTRSIPFAATFLQQCLKYMDVSMKNLPCLPSELTQPLFILHLESMFSKFILDRSPDCLAFRSAFPKQTCVPSTKSFWLNKMSRDVRMIVYAMASEYHLKAEGQAHVASAGSARGKRGRSSSMIVSGVSKDLDRKGGVFKDVCITKTDRSLVPSVLLSDAILEYQVHCDEMDTLESCPPERTLVIDEARGVSSSNIHQRLQAWNGCYSMWRTEDQSCFIVFSDEKTRNSAMFELGKMGARKAVSSDCQSAVRLEQQRQAMKKRKEKSREKKRKKLEEQRRQAEAEQNEDDFLSELNYPGFVSR